MEKGTAISSQREIVLCPGYAVSLEKVLATYGYLYQAFPDIAVTVKTRHLLLYHPASFKGTLAAEEGGYQQKTEKVSQAYSGPQGGISATPSG